MTRSLSHAVESQDESTPSTLGLTPTLAVIDRVDRPDIELNVDVTIRRDEVRRLFNEHDVPDGTPFFVDEDGSLDRLATLNAYLLEANRQRAYAGTTLATRHAPALARLLTFVRERHGRVDLTATGREDLTAYAEQRRPLIAPNTWNNELATLTNYFRYALEQGWIEKDPLPRWGVNRRVTLTDRVATVRRVRFLTEAQTRHFLNIGLRGDAAPDGQRPAYPSRDYALGLTLVSTGLRREEATFLLNCEVPPPEEFPSNGVHVFTRIGKGGRPRDVWLTTMLAQAIDQYRLNERDYLVDGAQRRLRTLRREGRLLIADGLDIAPDGTTKIRIAGKSVRAERLTNENRARIVQVKPDGLIDPLALFMVRGGTAPALRTVNHLFNDAAGRVANFGPHPEAPPSHLDVTPHVMRHTFAVRTLAGLIRHGRTTTGDPYALLASPVLTVQQLLGHADIATTHRYLFAAERYTDELPHALTEAIAAVVSRG